VEKTTYGGASWSVLLAKYYSGNQIKKNDMGGKYESVHGEERCVWDFGRDT